jgi:cytosine/adenosine deaminase-related metal-dependent hydrolase
VLGLEDQIGSLEVGKRADITVISRDGLHLSPQASVDPISALVYAHRATDVETVIIDGHIVFRDRRFTTLDEREIRQEAERSIEQLFDRVRPQLLQ